jgi:hypothetical protein
VEHINSRYNSIVEKDCCGNSENIMFCNVETEREMA